MMQSWGIVRWCVVVVLVEVVDDGEVGDDWDCNVDRELVWL